MDTDPKNDPELAAWLDRVFSYGTPPEGGIPPITTTYGQEGHDERFYYRYED